MKIYVASSWVNAYQIEVVSRLRRYGNLVYDFRNPMTGNDGFSLRDIDPVGWKNWTPAFFRDTLEHPMSREGFNTDFDAMKWADIFVLVTPCGRSAHLKAGWAMGIGKPTLILLSDGEPELMYRMATKLCITLDEVIHWISREGKMYTASGFSERCWPGDGERKQS